MKLTIYLHKDRTLPGVLVTTPDELEPPLSRAFTCLGKSDNKAAAKAGNPDRNPIEPYGDIPTGTYTGTVVKLGAQMRDAQRERTYGPHHGILLTPVSGQAKEATKRYGLAIHGGAPAANGGLRPTFGCVRTKDDAMGALVSMIGGQTVDVEVIEVA